jgi:hypothetical protein
MKPLKFLYTDGRDVVVTDSILETKKARYYLKGVTNFGLAVIKPRIFPGLILAVLGLIMICDAYFNLTPYNNIINLGPTAEFFIGTGTALLGVMLMILTRKKYALRIETAEGYKHVVISRSKEYINQVLTALRKAKMSTLGVR